MDAEVGSEQGDARGGRWAGRGHVVSAPVTPSASCILHAPAEKQAGRAWARTDGQGIGIQVVVRCERGHARIAHAALSLRSQPVRACCKRGLQAQQAAFADPGRPAGGAATCESAACAEQNPRASAGRSVHS